MYIYTHNMSCYIRIILWFCFWYPPCPSIRILIWYKNLRTRRLLTIAVKERGCRWLRSSLMTWWLWLCTFLRERLMHIIDAKIEKVISLWPCHRTLLHFSNYQRAKSPACSWGLSIQIAWFWCASVLLFQRNSWFLEVLRKHALREQPYPCFGFLHVFHTVHRYLANLNLGVFVLGTLLETCSQVLCICSNRKTEEHYSLDTYTTS